MFFDLNKIWYKKSFITYFLLPFSFLYFLMIKIRAACYRIRLFKSHRLSVPVIVVGNITVGGTGKTPLVIALAEYLKSQGYMPGIVSRGYGGRLSKQGVIVKSHHLAHEVGDEALVMFARTDCPIAIAANRVHAARLLLGASRCNIIISDDGLQHHALKRDVEIVLIDGARQFGNGYLLPAGPLREPLTKLKTVNFIVQNGGEVSKDFYEMTVEPIVFHAVSKPQIIKPLADFAHQKVHAVAAIAHPERFFQTLKALGIMLIPHIFQDHYHFSKKDFVFTMDDLPILMTEKDAVKCKSFADDRYWYLEISAKLDEGLQEALLTLLKKRSRKNVETKN